MALKIGTQYGESTEHFGLEDYKGNRREGRSNQQILDFLDANPDTLRGHDVKGNTDGIYEHIAGRGKINTRVGNRSDMFGHADYDEMKRMGWTNDAILKYLDQNPNQLANRNKARSSITPINTSAGLRSDMFGHKDYEAAREAGWHNQEILAYMDENPHLLADRNKPGANWTDAGDTKPLYDWVARQGTDENAPLYDWIDKQPNRHQSSWDSLPSPTAENPPETIKRSGDPGAVGKPGQLKIETGDDLTGRRRGLNSLKRKSTYKNSLGGVASAGLSSLNIA